MTARESWSQGARVDTLQEVVSTPSFIQAALLVALTGALSGFLIQWIKGSTDDKQARQQKIVDVEGNEFCVVKPNRADATRSLSCHTQRPVLQPIMCCRRLGL
jgi:hypothetical protein